VSVCECVCLNAYEENKTENPNLYIFEGSMMFLCNTELAKKGHRCGMEIPRAIYGKTTKKMEKMHVRKRVKKQWRDSLNCIGRRPVDISSIL